MVLFISRVSGKGQLRLKDLFSKLYMKKCLICIQNGKLLCLCYINEQLYVPHRTTTHQKAEWATETQQLVRSEHLSGQHWALSAQHPLPGVPFSCV